MSHQHIFWRPLRPSSYSNNNFLSTKISKAFELHFNCYKDFFFFFGTSWVKLLSSLLFGVKAAYHERHTTNSLQWQMLNRPHTWASSSRTHGQRWAGFCTLSLKHLQEVLKVCWHAEILDFIQNVNSFSLQEKLKT